MKLCDLTANLKTIESSNSGTFSPVFWDVFNCYFNDFLPASDTPATSPMDLPEDEVAPWFCEIKRSDNP